MTLKSLVVSLLALGVLAAVAVQAATDHHPAGRAARAGDRDGDGLPDRWERRHHVHSAKADPDHDGLTNRRELRLHTDPRVRTVRCAATADPGSFRSKLGRLRSGRTLCLAAGDYGTFDGSRAPAHATIAAKPGVGARMALVFDGTHDLTLDGLTITDARLLDATRHVTIRNARFTGFLTINGVHHSGILLEHNTHRDFVSGDDDPPARIHLSYGCDAPSGVTIRDSLFSGGDADGIQAGCGVTIVHNVFRDIQFRGSNHTDAIQLIGAQGSVVRHNYFKHTSTGIVAYDGVERATIEDNVIDVDDRGAGIELYSDDGSVVRHNTLRYYGGRCWYDQPCGQIAIDRKPEDDAGRGTVIEDNIATDITINNGSAVAVRRGNLVRRSPGRGDRRGAPRYVGGADPGSYAGFRLAAGSPGRRAASDGHDAGIG